ncbi:fibronectin type III domain-containing protein [Arthrobacter sp. NEB 688]|uniref:Ig-like domain-containing protein n=1 Tax=Arthrobacter sp. NEB 688 TaxID=904039 RepID=UPI0015635485|nr:fibronectin type III domain-containing protein [Arthrobacter sp. NEB 688]QKE83755.1 fibronectin type III domain-containing protein [Arthrobacter sp. NEB 688]
MATVVALVLGGYGWAATQSDGYPTDHPEANDGTLWVTNDRSGLFGRLNGPAARLDAAFPPADESNQGYALDVVQSGSSVLTRDRSSGRVTPVDVQAGALVTDRAVELPGRALLAVGGGTSAAVDPETGGVHVAHSLTPTVAAVDGLGSGARAADVVPIAPDATTDFPADVAVAADGTAYAAGSGGRMTTLSPTADGGFRTVRSSLGGPLQEAQLVLTPDGPVVLDTVSGVLVRPGGARVSLSGESVVGGVPQDVTTDGAVLVATPRALLSVDLRTGVTRSLATGGSGPGTAPVVLDGCAYAAWSGTPGRAVKVCSGAAPETVDLTDAGTLSSPRLRVNHRTVALNDTSTGAVWDLDSGDRLDDWAAVAPPSSQTPPEDTDPSSTVDRTAKPPQARDDEVGARPGRTSVLHVLDNDANPSGSVLSITRATGLPGLDGRVDISPDGQTVQLQLTPTARSTAFDYVIDDGRGNRSSARVTVTVRGPDENGAPVLRSNYVPGVTSVTNRGSVTVPVAGDWRDPDSDPVAVTGARDGDRTVGVTPDGRLRYTATGETGPRTLEYTVTDGAAPSTGQLSLDVLSPDATQPTSPTTLPDVGRGEVDKPIVLRPLENDIPGTDPTDPAARLQLAGNVTAPDGTTVSTSFEAGTVTVTASAPGTYLLGYTVRYGTANTVRGAMRVDVRAASERTGDITAMLDQTVLHGQTATITDVLANDVDPSGGLLTVQSAVADSALGVEVAVLRGRWLRIRATSPELRPNPVLVRYTVTNGAGKTATGSVSVLQLPAPQDDSPVAVDDTATVRSGDQASIPVLDNDLDPGGTTLRLAPQVEGAARSGMLPVGGADGGPTDEPTGAAYVAGSLVRYQAPEVTEQRTVTITYVVENANGSRASGSVRVTVTAPPSPQQPNRAPTPATLEGRVVAGDTITVSIAGSGADPDGDSTTLVGLASAPRLGRVLAVTPSSITYQAYPTSGGTDDITYLLGDRYTKVGTGTIRIAVSPPGDPQPVVAVDDEVTVAPGRRVSVDVLGNDIQPIGERATVQPLETLDETARGRARLEPATGRIAVVGPPPAAPLRVRYAILGSNGETSTATLTVRGREGVNLPPEPRNALARPAPGAQTVDVDLLAGAVDPDDPSGTLQVSRVFNAPGVAVVDGRASLPVRAVPQVLSFEVVDSGGAAALGLVHIPAGGASVPSVKPDALVRVERGGSALVDLSDVVDGPAGRPLTLTTEDRFAASPAGALRVRSEGPSRLRVTALRDYVGPAAIAFEVTTAASPTAGAGRRAFLTVPVQVGPETPVLRCPPTAVDVVVGGTSRPLGIQDLCHVWTSSPEAAEDLRYSGAFESPVAGLSVISRGGTTLSVAASSAAVPGTSARLLVTVDGTEAVPAVLTVRVAPAQPPTMDPVTVSGVRAGSTQTVSLVGYLSSPLVDPRYDVLGIEPLTGTATARVDGPQLVSVTPGPTAKGRLTFRVTFTDVEAGDRRDRQGTGTLTVDVLGTPDAPGAPTQAGPTLSRSARLAWTAPRDNGLPVEGYEVAWEGGTQLCGASPCVVTGLRNAVATRFTVRARNAVGYGPPSAASAAVTPDEVPGAPRAPRVTDPRDRAVTVAWDAAPSSGSAVDSYLVTWPGGRAEASTTSVTAGGLDNALRTPFTIRARNKAGFGPPVTVEGQSAGTPAVPDAPRVDASEIGGGARQVVVVSWSGVAPNGPGDTTYTVTRSGPGGTVTLCAGTAATRCEAEAVENDGSTYDYRVQAANDVNRSAPSAPTSRKAVGTPGDFTGLSATATGTDRQVELGFTSPPARDDGVTITCRVGGSSCGEWTAPRTPTDFDETVTVPENGSDYTFVLTATNSAGLSSSARVTSDVVYGPLGAVGVSVESTVGAYVTYVVTVDANGRAADVAVSVQGGVDGTLAPDPDRTGAGPWTQRYRTKVGYGRDVTIEATATRGGDSRSSSTTASTGTGTLAARSEGDVITLRARNLTASATMRCTITPEGGDPVRATFETDAGGDFGPDAPTTGLTPVPGTRYTITCDDNRDPATPVEDTWTAR